MFMSVVASLRPFARGLRITVARGGRDAASHSPANDGSGRWSSRYGLAGREWCRQPGGESGRRRVDWTTSDLVIAEIDNGEQGVVFDLDESAGCPVERLAIAADLHF